MNIIYFSGNGNTKHCVEFLSQKLRNGKIESIEKIEDIEYKQAKLDNETIDDIFAEVEDIDEIPIISIDSEEKE